MERNVIYNEDCVETMERMPRKCIDLVVTSPPYDDLRTYHGSRFDFEKVGVQLIRVLKDGGVIVWIVGDATVKGSETGTSFRQALWFKDQGLNLHDTMIFGKKGTAYPDKYRYYNCFHYMFVFSLGKPKTINLLKDRPNKWAGVTKNSTTRTKDGELFKTSGRLKRRVCPPFGVRWNIWKYSVGKYHSSHDNEVLRHPAVFPEKLAQDHVLSWSAPGDLVYDPFMGSGTTAKMAFLNDRAFVGSEMNSNYFDLSITRLSRYVPEFKELGV